MADKKRILVTSALPYANGPLHLGHLAGAYLTADLYVRYKRLVGDDVVYICGSDEHGVPITIAAEKEGVSPQDIVDRYHEMNKKVFEDFGISFDYYGRTSSKVHHQTSQEIFTHLNEKGFFRKKTEQQLYDAKSDMFLPDRYVKGTCPNCSFPEAYGDQCENCGTSLSPTELINPISALSGEVPELKETEHWYMPLGDVQPKFEKWLETREGWKPNVMGQVKSWLKDGLSDRAATRDLSWGVPVPLDEAQGKVLYVWFDAPIGYISATKEWAQKQGNPDAWKKYWQDQETELYHFIGKDNIVFHCIMFPIVLMEHGDYVLPKNVPANEFLNLEGKKLSTSRGWAVWLHEYLEDFEPDLLRYALGSTLPESKDSDFSWKDFQARVNNELAAVLGNFVNRSLTFTDKFADGKVPELVDPTETDSEALGSIVKQKKKVTAAFEAFRFKEAISESINLARAGNKYFTETEPWKTRNENPQACNNTLYVSLQICAALSMLMEPVLPASMKKLRNQLKVAEGLSWDEINDFMLTSGTDVEVGEVLFNKVEDSDIEKQIQKLEERAETNDPVSKFPKLKENIGFEDFMKLDLRAGQILSAEKIKKSDKLLKLQVDLGLEKRTIVSGIAKHVDIDSLKGQKVCVVANLAPKKLMGVESQGMILMAEDAEGNLKFAETTAEAVAPSPDMPLTSPSATVKELQFDNYQLGYTILDKGIVFRLFAPQADEVILEVFDHYEQTSGSRFKMTKDEKGIWNYHHTTGRMLGKWYGYSLHKNEESLFFEQTEYLIADPWSKHVTSRNHYLGFAKTKIIEEKAFDWEGDDFLAPKDPRDLVIYETHIKDMVAHPSAKTYVQGIYNDFREAEVGGINYLKTLGVNAVEFLPLQKFAYYEPPFNEKIEGGLTNTWNLYARNYWGYMTSFFFAPETIYASDATLEEKEIIGRTDAASAELKELVKALHKEEITVIMDVVYNHASQYDLNPLKYTDKGHYFRTNELGQYLNDSWTGNDIETQTEYSRKLIVESIKYWMTEYHIDGFRFDLAGILDWETVDLIKKEAQKINPNVILIAEPWGGEYKPAGFSDHGWASWNDRIRNGLKGYDPVFNKGFILGEWSHGTTRFALENFIRGTLESAEHGLFNSSKDSVNYIESHDGYTLGDFIRIALNPAKKEKVFKKKSVSTKLTKKELKVAKLGALSLFVSQGITMIHAGQEWARAKVITDHTGKDPNAGKLDHDSYNKDNGTNWLNFNEIKLNQELFDYYLGLIELRKSSPALRKAKPEEIVFKVYKDPLHITFSVEGISSGDSYDYFISLNANTKSDHEIDLPKGSWEVVADGKQVDSSGINRIQKVYNVAASSSVVLRKLRVSPS